MGFKSAHDAIGKKITSRDTLTIVGVVANFHQQGLKKPIDPQLMTLAPGTRSAYSVKLQTADLPGTITALKAVGTVFPDDPCNYPF